MTEKIVLITGAAGNLGSKIRSHLAPRYSLRLLDLRAGDDETIMEADLGQWSSDWVEQFRQVDTVIHLAANPSPFPPWHDLIESNVDSLINVFTAAAQNGVRRVIYASSNHAMGGYQDISEPAKLRAETPVRPGTRFVEPHGEQRDSEPYGAAKMFGERIGKCYADIYGMSTVAVRIGWIRRGDNSPETIAEERQDWYRLMWLSNRDFCQIFEASITADLPSNFAIINGMSNNSGMRWDVEQTGEIIGYTPQDNVTKE